MKYPLICAVLTAVSCHAASCAWEPAVGFKQIPIWPGIPPASRPLTGAEVDKTETKELVAGKPWQYVGNVSKPTITVYSPKENNTGAAVIVFPGGGYQILAMDLEGTEVCDWLSSKGITAVLLKYRVPGENKLPKSGHYPKSAEALDDAQRAIRVVRARAAQWHIDPHKIGVLGFSAGGHLSVAVSTHFKDQIYKPVDAVDKVSCRPDFAVALYPGHLALDGHAGLNPDIRVTGETPPQFIVQAENDPVDSIDNTLVYYAALKKAKVPTEIHLYAEGGHAFGLRPTSYPITKWPALVETWLRTIGIIKPA
ncbi:MAG TPA: alpha/beta hydrolase [Planktothrix sp.]|jgi:acetyl esterase/lipase